MKNIDFFINKEIRKKVKLFKENKDSLSTTDLNSVKLYLHEYKDVINSIQFFCGSIKDSEVVSCISNTFHEELLSLINNKFNSNISIIVSPEHKSVIFKQNSNLTISFTSLISKLCGDTYTNIDSNIILAPLTETFINFTQKLLPCTSPHK